MKCPKCAVEMKESTELVDGSVKVASANPGKGGHFGDFPHEYGSSGFGDLYENVKVRKKFRTCPKCGHKESAE